LKNNGLKHGVHFLEAQWLGFLSDSAATILKTETTNANKIIKFIRHEIVDLFVAPIYTTKGRNGLVFIACL
jgi:hypothetical protein